MDHYPCTGLDEGGGVCPRVRVVVVHHCCGTEAGHYHCGTTIAGPRLGRRHSPIRSIVVGRRASDHAPARIRILIDRYVAHRPIFLWTFTYRCFAWGTYVSFSRDEGTVAGAPAPTIIHAPALCRSTSTATRCTSPARVVVPILSVPDHEIQREGRFGTHMCQLTRTSSLRAYGQGPTRRRRPQDVHRHISQSSSTANWRTGPAFCLL